MKCLFGKKLKPPAFGGPQVDNEHALGSAASLVEEMTPIVEEMTESVKLSVTSWRQAAPLAPFNLGQRPLPPLILEGEQVTS